MSNLGALSQAWVTAEAALPLGWDIMGLTREDRTDRWTASASGPLTSTEQAVGGGDYPAQALNRLADALREIRGNTTG